MYITKRKIVSKIKIIKNLQKNPYSFPAQLLLSSTPVTIALMILNCPSSGSFKLSVSFKFLDNDVEDVGKEPSKDFLLQIIADEYR